MSDVEWLDSPFAEEDCLRKWGLNKANWKGIIRARTLMI